MKDLPDFQLCDLLSPHFLFVVLPLMILICPFNPFQAVHAAHEFQAARSSHFEFGGRILGGKNAVLNMEARAAGASHLLRKVVVSKAQDLTPAALDKLVSAGTGGLLLLLPRGSQKMSAKTREAIMKLEEHITSQEYEAPIYFATEDDDLLELEKELKADVEDGKSKGKSGAQALLDGITSNGFQMVSNATNPKMIPEQALSNIQGYLPGKGEPENLPTILVVAHYDAGGAAPSLSFGADSNGSGVSILLELARIFGELYNAGGESHAEYNLVFLLTGGGKLNYYGSKKWLEDQRDFQAMDKADFLSNIKLVVCLDSLGLEKDLHLHVSKPPKEGSAAAKFLADLQKAGGEVSTKVNLVHKKINLAHDLLAWEHERYSIAKLSAVTLSHIESHQDLRRNTITDTSVDQEVLQRNTQVVATALACTVYGSCPTAPKIEEKLVSNPENLEKWSKILGQTPRSNSLMCGPGNPFAKKLNKAMTNAGVKAKLLTAKREKRDADYTLYDIHTVTMNSYSIKPAVFDLVLTLVICCYLGLVYGVVINGGAFYGFLASLTVSSSSSNPGSPSKKQNGKAKAH